MLRVSKMTDYGVIALCHMRDMQGQNTTAPELSAQTGLPQPTIAKILKLLARANVVSSTRGAGGGYALARNAKEINVADIIEALDGPVALTACVDGAEGSCDVESLCPMRGMWDPINFAVRQALESVCLADLNRDLAVPDFINIQPVHHKKVENLGAQATELSAQIKD